MNIGKLTIGGKTYTVSIKSNEEETPTPAPENHNEDNNFSNIPCARCIIRNPAQFEALHRCIDSANRALEKDNSNVSILKLGQSERTNNSSIVAVDIGACPNDMDTIVNTEFYKVFIQEILRSTSIEYEFIRYDECFKNTIDDDIVSINGGYNLICIERSEIGDAAFNTLCKKVYDTNDVSDIISIRFRCTGFDSTTKCNWGNSYKSTKSEGDVKPKENISNSNTKTASVFMVITGEDKSSEFDKFVKGKNNIRFSKNNITGAGKNLFRTVSMCVTYDDIDAFGSLVNTMANFGSLSAFI